MTLTNDQVRDLCRRRNAGIIAAAAATQPAAAALLTGAKPEHLQALIKDGAQARNTLVEANVGLVHTVVGRNIHGSRHDEDYLQEGMTALIDAVDRYDPDRGAFSSYAVPYIRGAVLNLLNARSGESHLNPHQARSRERIRAQIERLEAAGTPATTTAIAQELGQTEHWVRRHASYERHTTLDPKDQQQVQIPDRTSEEHIDAVGTTPLNRYLRMLPEHERTALELAHGFTGQPRSITEIGHTIGISRNTAQRYVASGHIHLGQLLRRLDQQLTEGRAITSAARPTPTRQPTRSRPLPAQQPRP